MRRSAPGCQQEADARRVTRHSHCSAVDPPCRLASEASPAPPPLTSSPPAGAVRALLRDGLHIPALQDLCRERQGREDRALQAPDVHFLSDCVAGEDFLLPPFKQRGIQINNRINYRSYN